MDDEVTSQRVGQDRCGVGAEKSAVYKVCADRAVIYDGTIHIGGAKPMLNELSLCLISLSSSTSTQSCPSLTCAFAPYRQSSKDVRQPGSAEWQ